MLNIKLIDKLYYQGGVLAGIIACYVLGLIAFACGRWLHGLAWPKSTFHTELKADSIAGFAAGEQGRRNRQDRGIKGTN